MTGFFMETAQIRLLCNKLPANLSQGTSDTVRPRVFENSVLPMLNQVRLHPRLVTDSTELEASNEK